MKKVIEYIRKNPSATQSDILRNAGLQYGINKTRQTIKELAELGYLEIRRERGNKLCHN